MTILKRRTIALAAGAALLALSLGAIPAGATDRDDRKKDSNEECKNCYDGKKGGNKLTVEPGTCCIRVRAHHLRPGTTVTATASGPITRSTSFTVGRNGRGEGNITGLKDGSYTVRVSGGGHAKTRTVKVRGCPEEERPTPTTTTTTTLPPTDDEEETETTSTNRGRTPPSASAPSTPAEAAPPADAAPPSQTMNALPFTGPRDLLLPAGLGLFTLGLALLLAARRREGQLDIATRAVARALRKPYRGPRETL